jgi:hypothetical protein
MIEPYQTAYTLTGFAAYRGACDDDAGATPMGLWRGGWPCQGLGLLYQPPCGG